MFTATMQKWQQVKETCEALNHALWTDAFKSDETKAIAERALDAMQEKAQRCIRILRHRYNTEV